MCFLSASPLWQQGLVGSAVAWLPSVGVSSSAGASVVVPPPACVGRSFMPTLPSSFSLSSLPSAPLARPGRSLLAKRLGKDARRRERRTEKELLSSAGSSGLCGASKDEELRDLLSGEEEESLRSSGLEGVELGERDAAGLAGAEGAGTPPLLGLREWE